MINGYSRKVICRSYRAALTPDELRGEPSSSAASCASRGSSEAQHVCTQQVIGAAGCARGVQAITDHVTAHRCCRDGREEGGRVAHLAFMVGHGDRS